MLEEIFFIVMLLVIGAGVTTLCGIALIKLWEVLEND